MRSKNLNSFAEGLKAVIDKEPATSKRDGPSKDGDPGDRHSGEGVASVRPRLARTLADFALLNGDGKLEATADRTPIEPPPEPEAPSRAALHP